MDNWIKLGHSPVLDLKNKDDFDDIYAICNALGNEKRLCVLKALNVPPYVFSVSRLSKELKLPISTLMHHLNILEKACLVKYEYHSSPKGDIRMYRRGIKTVTLSLYNTDREKKKELLTSIQNVKVGMFSEFYGEILNIATRDNLYYTRDGNCFIPQRYDAELVFSPLGIIEYYFDNSLAKKHKITGLLLSFEICSEAPFYDANYKSSVTFWINGVYLTTHTLIGDFGDRPGKLNPEWWAKLKNTQHGQILTVSVNDSGVFINGLLVNNKVRISDLQLEKGNKTSFKLGNEDTATHPGGFNLFGSGFGDYEQDIVLQLTYENETAS